MKTFLARFAAIFVVVSLGSAWLIFADVMIAASVAGHCCGPANPFEAFLEPHWIAGVITGIAMNIAAAAGLIAGALTLADPRP